MPIEEADTGGAPSGQPGTASSPYATGGGGVTFAHRVAAVYLTSILTGARRAELDERSATSVSFQTAPAHAVDDLLVTAEAAGEPIEVAIACRATPNFVPSDAATVSLIKTVLADLEAHKGQTSTVVIAVAGWKPQWNQVAQLCEIARTHGTAADFNTVLSQDGTWSQSIRDRHRYLCDMVALATGNKRSSPATNAVRAKTWSMLTHLRVVGFDVQAPRDAEWTATASLLDSVTSESGDGIALRDALASRAATYDAAGAKSITVHTLRRDMRGMVNPSVGRTRSAWDTLAEQRRAALASVRHTLGIERSGRAPLQFDFEDRRKQLSEKMLIAADAGGAVVVAGESGTGKSALVLSAVLNLESNPANSLEAVIVNMRELPSDSMSLHAALGANLKDVLGELDAPRRLLVVDGADVAAERSSGLLRDLLSAAFAASVAVIVVSADFALDFVTELVHASHTDPADYVVDPLNDDDLAQVSTHVPALTGILREVPKASLLRRLVVLDLLSRTGLKLDHPMGEWECLELIWATVVRGDGRPVSGSAEARDRTLVLLAKAALEGAESAPGLDAASIDALRADRLLAPYSPFHQLPQFAHDEVRRYATAMHLVRRSDMVDAVASAGTPRWALSAATLACKGRLSDPSAAPASVFAGMVRGFRDIALTGAARWADVPIEAVLDTPSAYDCFSGTVGNEPANLDLEEVVRVVQQRLAVDGFIGRAAEPVVRLLLDDPTPWLISNAAFKLLTSWLRTTASVWFPAGHPLRVRLRGRLLDFWNLHSAQSLPDDSEIGAHAGQGRRRHHALDYRLTDAEFVESLAMLGEDTNADIENCLRAIANDAPAYLAPAADSPFSARSLVQYKPELLAELMEAYYIDDDLKDDWSERDEGIREHDSQWSGMGPPFNAHYFGSFWTLFQVAPLDTSVRVLNNILNHAAKARVQLVAGLRQPLLEHGMSEDEDEPTGAELTLDGTTRNYVGDSGIWFWYRGTSVGPYPCMSALQAMERVLEPVFQVDDAVQPAVEKLLASCENLAVPGLLYGLLVRNIEHAGPSLDPFLAEPRVWDFEFSRCVSEHYGFKADSEGLAHPERRAWTPRDACITLVTAGDEDRRATLQAVGDLLKKNGERLGRDSLLVRTWAAHLDIERFRFERHEDQTYLVVEPPEEAVAASAPQVAQQEHVNATLSIQNKYTQGIYDHKYVSPPAAETAVDLAAVRRLLEAPIEGIYITPHTAAALVVRNAIRLAANGEPDALGNEGSFAVQFVLQIVALLAQGPDQSDEDQYYEIGADRSAASALPLLLTSNLAGTLIEAGTNRDQVIELGQTFATRASHETRLFLARAFDLIWESPCYGTPCSHAVVLDWAIDAARGAVIGSRSNNEQQRERTHITGDLLTRLEQVPGDSIYIAALDATIRSAGAAAVHDHCTTNAAQKLLAGLLEIQPRAMISHEKRHWVADHRGSHTLIAARALLTGYTANENPDPILAYLDTLRSDAGLVSNFLHGLAGSGAEARTRADAASHLWPSLLKHALTYAVPSDTSIYNQSTWGSWAAAALLPQPVVWSQGLYNELQGEPIDWVEPASLIPLIDDWIQASPADMKVVDALLGFTARLSEVDQIAQGIRWVSGICVQDGIVVVKESYGLADWLKQTRLPAELHGHGDAWQRLVDALVVAGNTELAPFSR